jgi:HEAT repeats
VLTAFPELLQKSLAGTPEVVGQGPVAVGLLDHSDFVFDTRNPDHVRALTELFLGDAFGQRVVADRLAKPLIRGLAFNEDGAALSAGASQGVEIPDFRFDSCDVTHLFSFLLNICIMTCVGNKKTHVVMKQIDWTEAALVLVGVAAVGVLLTLPFRPCQPINEAEVEISLPSRADRETCDQVRATACEKDVSVLLKQVRCRKVGITTTVVALTKLGPAMVPALVPSLDDGDPAVRFVATRTISCLASRLEPQGATLMPALIRRLRDPKGEIRYAAIFALFSFGPSREEAIPELIATLRDTNRLSEEAIICLQQGAAHVLGKIGPNAKAAIPALNWLLHDETSHARNAAATALWRISCDTNLVLPPLCSMLAETNSSARLQAAAALERINREIELSPELMAEVETVKRRHGEPLTLAEAS